MIKLAQILKVHAQEQNPLAIEENLGDAFLLNHNPVFWKIRQSVLEIGFKIKGDRFYDFDVLALTQLPKILEKKTIPFRNTVRPLQEIEVSVPKAFCMKDLPAFRANYILHESAHALARRSTEQVFKKMKHQSQLKMERQTALLIFLEESFANACESFSNIFAETEIHQEFLLSNSYIVEKAIDKRVLRKALDLIDWQVVFKTLILSFLIANFNQTKTAIADFDRILNFVFKGECSQMQKQILKKVFKIGFDLDPEFTENTHSFCLKLAGVKTPFQKLVNFDFFASLEKQALFQDYLQALCDWLRF